MTLALRFKQLEKLAVDNSPALLTAIGVVGTITTALLTHKAATKVEQIICAKESVEGTHGEFMGRLKERAPLVWKLYIPPVVVGSLTLASIVGSNRIGSKRAAAVAAAYTISEKAYSEYRERVVATIGDNKERAIRDDVVRARLAENPPSESNMVVIGSGDVRCHDMYSGRYFDSSVEEIKKAMNDTNYQINTHGYASLTDFYERIGLPRNIVSEEVGWTSDKLMDISFTTILSEDGRPCVAITFSVSPVREYHKFR
jgi:hypothetical protein